MKTQLLSLLALGFMSLDAFATAQIGEILEYEGKREEIYATPLESYFTADKKRPEFPVQSSGCWRGYVGLWSLKDNQLYLVSLHELDYESKDILGKKIPLSLVFGSENSPVKADWFTGVLRLPRGEQLRYVHMGFGTIFEKDIYLTFKNGKLVARREVNNRDIGATRSTSDLEWVALAEQPVPDEGKWVDARLLADDSSAREVKTRGIFFTDNAAKTSHLWIPDTPTTGQIDIALALHSKPEIPPGSHVEVTGRYDSKTQTITVASIRELKAGESIHHAKFVAPKQPKN